MIYQKGVKLIERALEYQPNNSYYLDSLAWGYYKLNMCQKALNAMKKVIDIEGIEEEDIAMHWRAIQKCESKEQRIGKNFRWDNKKDKIGLRAREKRISP